MPIIIPAVILRIEARQIFQKPNVKTRDANAEKTFSGAGSINSTLIVIDKIFQRNNQNAIDMIVKAIFLKCLFFIVHTFVW